VEEQVSPFPYPNEPLPPSLSTAPVKEAEVDLQALEIDVTVLVPLCNELKRSPYVLSCGFSPNYGVEGPTYSLKLMYRDPFASSLSSPPRSRTTVMEDGEKKREEVDEEFKEGKSGGREEEGNGPAADGSTNGRRRPRTFLHQLLQDALFNLCSELSALEGQLKF
jgi:hypothetical protein